MSDKIYRFTASWCQPCKMLAKNLEESSLDVPIEVVDIDVHTEMATQYGIRSIPTLVFVSGEQEKSRLIGVKTSAEINTWALTAQMA